MNEMILNVIAAVLIMIGSLLSLVASIGLFRLPDVYTRAHAASKAATLGVMFVMSGVMFFFLARDHFFQPALLLAILFIFMTGPIGGHLLMRTAYHNGVKYTDQTVRDDLKEAE